VTWLGQSPFDSAQSMNSELQMSFGLNPKDYMAMVEETYQDFKADQLSLRHLISCCVFANHLPEIIVATYAAQQTVKLHGNDTVDSYRAHAIAICPEIAVVRDLCDFAKHGPYLSRKSVQVDKTAVKTTFVLDTASFVMGIPNHVSKEKLIVTLKDGNERFADFMIAKVVDYWKRTILADDL
jgi:hypothetical protein